MTTRTCSSRRPLALLALLACLLAGLTVAGGDHATAARTSVRPGLGRHGGGEFIGFYLTRDGTKVYCLRPRLATPASVSLRTVARYPGLSLEASDALAYALTTWGDARSRDAAAVESQVVNTLVGNRADVARRNRHLPASLRRLVRVHVAQAHAMHGPYRLQVTTPAAPLPGAGATGRVRLVSALGHPVAGVRVGLRATANARVPAAVRTDRHGLASFGYRVVDTGEVRVSATTDALPGTAVRITDPRAGEQRLAGGSARVSVRAASTFRGTAGGFSHRYSCTSDCAGRPVVVLTACASASRVASRIVYRFAGRVVTVDFPASGRRGCRPVRVAAPDRAAVTGTWQFRTAYGWSRPLPAGGTFVVDCPAPPAVAVSMVYDCSRARVTAALVAPVPGRSAVLVVSGARTARVSAAAGRPVTWTATMPCGSHLQLTFRSGVRRTAGSWNYGRSASVITP